MGFRSDSPRVARRTPIRLIVAGLAWPPETFIARLLQRLASNGIEVTVATDRSPREPWAQKARLKWLWAPAWYGPAPLLYLRLAGTALAALLRSPRSFAVLARSISRNILWSTSRFQMWNRTLPYVGRDWDVLYIPWNLAAVLHLPLFEMGRPVVISCRGHQINIAPHNRLRGDLERPLAVTFEKAAAVHCVSEHIRGKATGMGLDPAKGRVIRPAVDPAFFRPASGRAAPNGAIRIVTTASLSWRKGHEYAISAIHRLVSQGITATFTIVGEGRERARLLYTIRDLGLEGRVLLPGRLDPKGVRDELMRSDVFLLPSLSEGISNSALEAMACGLPVVTTDCGGMREAVTDGVEGFVVPVRDPEALAGALARLARDPALRANMGQAARARVEREFTLDEQGRRFVELYQDVVSHWPA
ncbi:MAG: glycosyltransferase family 4 protein [Thermoanaerobaculia bacterium]